MPDLGMAVTQFSRRFKTVNGRTIKGQLREPRNIPAAFSAQFVPRHVLIVDAYQVIPDGTIVYDVYGERFFAARYGEGNYGHTMVNRLFAMFQISDDVEWAIDASTQEPVSGIAIENKVVQPDLIPIQRSPAGTSKGPFAINSEAYAYLTNAPVEVGHYIENRRIHRVEHNYGLTYAQSI